MIMNINNNEYQKIGEINFSSEKELMLFLFANSYSVEVTKKYITMIKGLALGYSIVTSDTWVEELKDGNNGALYYDEFEGYILEI